MKNNCKNNSIFKRTASGLLTLLVILAPLCFIGCSDGEDFTPIQTPTIPFPSAEISDSPYITPEQPFVSTIPDSTPDNKETESSIPTEPTFNPATVLPPITKHDPEKCFGPYYFGDEMYYIFLDGDTISIFDPFTEIDFISIEAQIPEDREMFFITASLIDLNFDGYPDFSFQKNAEGQSECFFSSVFDLDGEVRYYKDEFFSSLYNLTRCYENLSLYGKRSLEDNEYLIWNMIDGDFVLSEETIPDIFEWNSEKIAQALFGDGTTVEKSEDVVIRGHICECVTVFGTLTIANDKYGHYYIKDMPTSGFCRLMLNPDGRWSKSEKVSGSAI